MFNKELKAQFEAFYACLDIFSLTLLGICNGCQRMALRVPWKGIEDAMHEEAVPLRVALRERAREVERDHAAGHGERHAGRVGGARRWFWFNNTVMRQT